MKKKMNPTATHHQDAPITIRDRDKPATSSQRADHETTTDHHMWAFRGENMAVLGSSLPYIESLINIVYCLQNLLKQAYYRGSWNDKYIPVSECGFHHAPVICDDVDSLYDYTLNRNVHVSKPSQMFINFLAKMGCSPVRSKIEPQAPLLVVPKHRCVRGWGGGDNIGEKFWAFSIHSPCGAPTAACIPTRRPRTCLKCHL